MTSTILVVLLSLFGPTLSNKDLGDVLLGFSAEFPDEDCSTPPHVVTARGTTPLHLAAASGSPAAIQELALAKVDLNARDHRDRTALHLAISLQDLDAVKQLLRFGALTNITDQEGRSALDLALETNNIMITGLLRFSGAKEIKYALKRYRKSNSNPITIMATSTASTTIATTTTNPPFTRLHKATRSPKLRKLTEKEKRMYEAVRKMSYKKIADLCAEGVDPNVADIQNNGYTPLHLAAANGRLSLLTLARCSANLNARDFDGNTPLHIAAMNDSPWSVIMLLMLGAAPNIKNNEGELPQDLVTPGMNSNFKLSFEPETMEWIRGIRKLSDGEQSLLEHVQLGHYNDIALSCKDGVDVHVKDVDHKQYTMLHYAVSINRNIPETIQMLLRCGADINARDVDGNTPLHAAVFGRFETARMMLLLNGADPFLANKDGKTAYQVLRESSPGETDDRFQWYRNGMPL